MLKGKGLCQQEWLLVKSLQDQVRYYRERFLQRVLDQHGRTRAIQIEKLRPAPGSYRASIEKL